MKRIIKENDNGIKNKNDIDRKLSLSSKQNDRRLSIKSTNSIKSVQQINTSDPPKKKSEELCNFVDEFLNSIGKSPLTQKSGQISQKSFIAAAQNIIHLIDPTFIFDKFDHDFKDLMEFMGYPYQVRTTDLQIIGASNRKWATVYPLYWLVHLLIEDNKYELQENDENIDDDLRHRLFFFGFLRRAYERWMQEGDEPLNDIEGEMTNFFRKGDDDQEKVNQILIQEEKNLIENLENLNQSDESKETLISKLNELQTIYYSSKEELLQLEKSNEIENELLNSLKNKEEKLINTKKESELELSKLLEKMNILKINPDELLKKNSEIIEIEKNLEIQKENIQNIDKEINKFNKLIIEEKEAINMMLNDLNNYYQEINIDNKINLSNNIDNDLINLRNNIIKMQPLNDELEIEENRIENEKKTLELENKSLDKEIELLSKEIKQLNDFKNSNKQSLQKQINDLKANESKKASKFIQEKREAENKLQEVIQAFEKHKDIINSKVSLIYREMEKIYNFV